MVPYSTHKGSAIVMMLVTVEPFLKPAQRVLQPCEEPLHNTHDCLNMQVVPRGTFGFKSPGGSRAARRLLLARCSARPNLCLLSPSLTCAAREGSCCLRKLPALISRSRLAPRAEEAC